MRLGSLFLISFFLMSCMSTNKYYVDQEHLNKARMAEETVAIPALDEERKSVAIQIAPGSIRDSVRWKFGGSLFWQGKDSERCLHPVDSQPDSDCIPLTKITHSESTVARTAGFAMMVPAGLLFILALASDNDCFDCKDDSGLIAAISAVPLLIGGAFVYFGWPSDPEVERPGPGFPERIGETRKPPVGLSLRGSF
jgi:hypothetical protein